MGNPSSRPQNCKNSHCQCCACANFKLFKDSSFIFLEQNLENQITMAGNPTFFSCFTNCAFSSKRKMENWKKYFLDEMKKIKKDYYWALPLLKSIKRSNDDSRAHFSNEINFINYLTNIFEDQTEFLEKPLLKSNNIEFKENFWLLKHEKNLNKEEITLLLNNLGIFPEQYFSFDANENNEGINISHEFYYRNSQTNDKIFTFDKKTKSTKESIGVCARVKRSLREKREKSIADSVSNHNIYEYKNNTILGMMQINQSLLDENEEIENNKRKIQNLHHYKLITDVIEKHLDNNRHPLFLIKKKFLEFYLKFYKELSMEVKFLEDLAKKKKYQRAIYEDSFCDLQRFLKIFQETTAIYYNLYSYKNFMSPPYFFCKDNLLNFITSLMFSKTEVYDLLLELQIQQDFETEIQIEANLQKFELLPIEEYNIPMKFWLNLKKIGLKPSEISEENSSTFVNNGKNGNLIKQSSLHRLNSSPSNSLENVVNFEKYHSKTENITPVGEENIHKSSLFRTISLCPCNFKNHRISLNIDENFKNLGKNILRRSNFLQKKSKTKKFESEKHLENNEAYCKAINNLKKIETIKSPILKLKNIIKTSVLIIDEIKHFYEENKIQMDFHLESDDILSIFIYICAKAHVKYLYSQCKLTEKFLSNKIANSISGYYLITLMASLSFFAEKKTN